MLNVHLTEKHTCVLFVLYRYIFTFCWFQLEKYALFCFPLFTIQPGMHTLCQSEALGYV